MKYFHCFLIQRILVCLVLFYNTDSLWNIQIMSILDELGFICYAFKYPSRTLRKGSRGSFVIIMSEDDNIHGWWWWRGDGDEDTVAPLAVPTQEVASITEASGSLGLEATDLFFMLLTGMIQQLKENRSGGWGPGSVRQDFVSSWGPVRAAESWHRWHRQCRTNHIWLDKMRFWRKKYWTYYDKSEEISLTFTGLLDT